MSFYEKSHLEDRSHLYYYRAFVEKVENNGQRLTVLVDPGLGIPHHRVQILLKDILMIDCRGIEAVENMVLNRWVTIQTYKAYRTHTYTAEVLLDDGTCVNEELINRKLADRRQSVLYASTGYPDRKNGCTFIRAN